LYLFALEDNQPSTVLKITQIHMFESSP